jgi:hypothetical protein
VHQQRCFEAANIPAGRLAAASSSRSGSSSSTADSRFVVQTHTHTQRERERERERETHVMISKPLCGCQPTIFSTRLVGGPGSSAVLRVFRSLLGSPKSCISRNGLHSTARHSTVQYEYMDSLRAGDTNTLLGRIRWLSYVTTALCAYTMSSVLLQCNVVQ